MSDREDKPEHSLKMLAAACACDPDAPGFGVLIEPSSSGVHDQHLALWFETPSAFCAFLTEAFPVLFCGDDDVDELIENLMPLARVIQEEGLSQSVLDELNEYTAQWIRFDWLGTFDDLCAADTEATRTVVGWFRRDAGEEGGAPINSEEVDDFAEFLTSLGDQ